MSYYKSKSRISATILRAAPSLRVRTAVLLLGVAFLASYLWAILAAVQMVAVERNARLAIKDIRSQVTLLEEHYLSLEGRLTRNAASSVGLSDALNRTVFASRIGKTIQTARVDQGPVREN